jgi:hypothetical protein
MKFGFLVHNSEIQCTYVLPSSINCVKITLHFLMNFKSQLTMMSLLTIYFCADQNCAYACHGFAALASACPSAKDQVALIALVAHAWMSHAASQAATHVTTAVDQTAACVVICRAAIQATTHVTTAVDQTAARVVI